MDNAQQDISGLWQRLHEDEEDVQALRLVLSEVQALAERSPRSEVYDLLAAIFERLQKATLELSEDGQEIILQYLLPWLTRDDEPAVDEASAYGRSEARKTLRTWLVQYPSVARHQLIDTVLNTLVAILQEHASSACCWTVSALGFRRRDIVDALWRIASEDPPDRADIAFRALATHALAGNERERLLRSLHGRFLTRPTWPLISALQDLADPTSVPVILTFLKAQRDSVPEEDGFTIDLMVQAMVEIADRHDNDAGLQTQIWDGLVGLFEAAPGRFGQSVYLGAHAGPRCDTPKVIISLLGFLQRNRGDSDGERYRRYLLYLRALECIRPRQLRGLRNQSNQETREVVWRDVAQQTDETARWGTMQSYLRSEAWHVLLTTGDHHILVPDDLSEMLAPESNAPWIGAVLNDVAGFQLDALPPIITTWITQDRELRRGEPAQDVSYRVAAIRVAHSAATPAAFAALVRCGLTFEGFAMQETASALADVSLLLIQHSQAHSVDVIETLLNVAQSDSRRHRRTAAMYALWRLASAGKLPTSTVAQVAAWTQDPDRDDFERSRAVQIFGGIAWDALPAVVQEMLARLAEGTDERMPESANAAIEALVNCGELASLPDLLARHTPISVSGDRWVLNTAASTTDRTVTLIASLYFREPRRMAEVMASSLHAATFFELNTLLDAVLATHQQKGTKPAQVVLDALHALLRRVGHPALGSTISIFDAAAFFLPESLLGSEWVDRWASWSPAGRLGYADALGRGAYISDASRKEAARLMLLLMRDARFDVRRSACRSLLAIAPRILREFSVSAALVPAAAWRQRAAEALEWVEGTGFPEQTRRALAIDRDPTVREALEQAMDRRRSRAWARVYADRLGQAIGRGNDTWLHTWRYCRALAKLGDDTIAMTLRADLEKRILTPSERHTFRTLLRELEEHWKKETETWPAPTLALREAIEIADATMKSASESDPLRGIPCSVYLFEIPSDPGDTQAVNWFGACVPRRSDQLLDRSDLYAVVSRPHVGTEIPGQLSTLRHMPDGVWSFGALPLARETESWR